MISRAGSVGESILLGSSPVMRDVRDKIATLAGLDWHVRIEGPSGTGKSIAARLVHDLSRRANAAFVLCSLAMLPDGNAELSELVGHKRGAFTGAVTDRAGKLEDAHMGTLFLDELETASPRVQEVLLQLVDTSTFSRMGENRLRKVDVRFVFATNESPERLVAQGRFRLDLHHRLELLVVHMPGLAQHREDIPELADGLLRKLCGEAGRPVPSLPSEVTERLCGFSWPGNVRQLASVLKYYVAFNQLPDMIAEAPPDLDWRDHLQEVLSNAGGNKAAAARALGVSRKMLYDELKRREA